MVGDRFKLVAAVHVFLIRGGRVLLLRRRNTGYRDGSYSIVAGHLDGGETVFAAAVREAAEEIGVRLEPDRLRVAGVMHRWEGDERVDFFVEATAWSGKVTNAEPAKCDRVCWCDLDPLPDNVVPYIRRALANHRSGVWFDSYGWKAAPTGGDARNATIGPPR